MKKSISWRKWVDPLDDVNDLEQKIAQKRKESHLDDEDELDSDKEMKTPPDFRVLQTPYGIIPITENNLPSNNFDFWIGYSNFNIDEAVVDILNRIPGIEILDIFSRYTFRIGIGRHPDFTFRSVRKIINEILCDPQRDKEDEILIQMSAVQDKVKEHKYWAILALPNGCIQSVFTDDDDDKLFQEKLSTYRDLTIGVGAIIATSEDRNVSGG